MHTLKYNDYYKDNYLYIRTYRGDRNLNKLDRANKKKLIMKIKKLNKLQYLLIKKEYL